MTTSSHLTAVPDVPPLELGSHTVNLECPDCRAVLPTPFTLSAEKHATTERSLLKLRMTNNKALEHHCGETGDGAGTPPMFGDAAAADPFGGDPFGDKS